MAEHSSIWGCRSVEDRASAFGQHQEFQHTLIESIVQISQSACAYETIGADQAEDLKIGVYLSTLLFFKMSAADTGEQKEKKKAKKKQAGANASQICLRL
jgi:hypothetical protein